MNTLNLFICIVLPNPRANIHELIWLPLLCKPCAFLFGKFKKKSELYFAPAQSDKHNHDKIS